MILCNHCGHQNKNKGTFCTSCGNRLLGDCYIVGRLSLLSGEEEREYLLADADRYIGRDPGNDIVVPDEAVSAQHARISFRDRGFWVEDLRSTNGTFVNEERIAGPVRLRDEDLLKMGHTFLAFKI